MVNLNAVGSLKPNRSGLAIRRWHDTRGNARVDTPFALPDRWWRQASSFRPPRTITPNQSGSTYRITKVIEWFPMEHARWKGATLCVAQYSSCFSHLMPTHGRRVHIFTSKETPPPSYFILESPPRTRLLKWFSELAESMTTSDPGLFNNQTLL